MSKEKYKIGILGCASIAVRSVMPAFHDNDRFTIEAIASRSLDKVQPIAQQYGCRPCTYEELMDDQTIDLVYIPLPTGLHYEWIIKALRKGKHVLSEKSLGTSLTEVEEMVELARESGCLLMENFQFRFHPQTEWVRNYIAEGNIGEIRCFRSQFGFPPFKDATNIRYSKSLGGGALLDAGAYTLKSMSIILPDEKFKLKSASKIIPDYAKVDIWGGAHLESQNGVMAELAYGFDNFYQCGFEVWGSIGRLVSTRAYTAPANLEPKIIVETSELGLKEFLLSNADHFSLMTNHVAQLLDSRDFEDEYKQNILQASFIHQINNYIENEQ